MRRPGTYIFFGLLVYLVASYGVLAALAMATFWAGMSNVKLSLSRQYYATDDYRRFAIKRSTRLAMGAGGMLVGIVGLMLLSHFGRL